MSREAKIIRSSPASTIQLYSQKEFDEYSLPLSAVADGKYAKTQHVEGKVTGIYYLSPVALWVYDPGGGYGMKSYLAVIESKPMEAGLVTVNAASLAGGITRTGHASVYGILFETGKADVKAESDPTPREIGKLLQQNAALKLYVVGHTDNQGTVDMNMDLSRRRAQAVMAALATKYGVPAARLAAFGAGPYAPVASNDAEEGRAKNRRVELVKQ